MVSRLHACGASGAERLLRVPDGSARARPSRNTSTQEDGRHRLVLLGRPGESGRGLCADPRVRAACPGRDPADAVSCPPDSVRSALPGGAALAVARRLRQHDPGRGDRGTRALRRDAADVAIRDASLPNRRSGPRPRSGRRPRSAIATHAGPRSWSEWTRTRPRVPRRRDWTTAYWEALHPYSAGGAYVNMYMDEGQDRVRTSYRANYDRLVADEGAVRSGQRLPSQPEHPSGLTREPPGQPRRPPSVPNANV